MCICACTCVCVCVCASLCRFFAHACVCEAVCMCACMRVRCMCVCARRASPFPVRSHHAHMRPASSLRDLTIPKRGRRARPARVRFGRSPTSHAFAARAALTDPLRAWALCLRTRARRPRRPDPREPRGDRECASQPALPPEGGGQGWAPLTGASGRSAGRGPTVADERAHGLVRGLGDHLLDPRLKLRGSSTSLAV